MAIISFWFPGWWDREVDQFGRTIRSDVRKAVDEVWQTACRYTEVELGDVGEAMVLMEATVAQISAYLDNNGVALNHPDHEIPGLLMNNFWFALQRRKLELERMEPLGEAVPTIPYDWEHTISLQLDLLRLCQYLSPRGREILFLRLIGCDWKFIAQAHGLSVSRAKHVYARELERIRRILEASKTPKAGTGR